MNTILTKIQRSKDPLHPKLSVLHNCFEPLGLDVTKASKRLGISSKQVSDIVNGYVGISPEMATRFDKAFGGGAETWYRLQITYDLAAQAKKKTKCNSIGI